jgi:PAS domain S-box-containing protein
MLGLARDITGQLRAQREQALLAAIVESSEDAIVSLSPDLRIMSWNHGAEKLLGFSAQETVGAPTTIYIPPEMREWGVSFLKSLMGKLDRVHSFEVPCLRKDGSRIDVWTVCCGIHDASGRLLGMSAIHRDITERKRAEQARDYLAAIVESSDDAIVSIDLRNIITGWNRSAERMFGFTAAEAVGQPVTITIPPDARETALEMIAGFRKHPEQVVRLEVPFQTKCGSLIDVSLAAFGVRDRSGKLLGISAVHRDISERRRAEREQALLAAIVESSEDAIITKGRGHDILTWNAGAERLYGYSAAEVVGKPIAILTPPDRVDELKKLLDRVLKGEKIQDYETKRLHKSGRLLDVSLSEAPVRDARGQVLGVAAIERDIGERVRARHLEAQMASIVKSSTDAIYSLGPGHVIQTWNPGAERMFGYRAEDVIGKPSPTMVPECQAQLDEMLSRVLEDEQTVAFESQRRRKDGVILDVSVTASPIYDNSGTVCGVAVITRDITERKRAERALIETQNELRARMRQQAAVARLIRTALSKLAPQELIAEAAGLTVETLGVDSCAILELLSDGKSVVRRNPSSEWGDSIGRAVASIDSYAEYVLRCADPVLVGNFAAENRFSRGQLLAGPDAVSGLAVVIPDTGRPLGIVAAHSKTAREFSRDDINFVQAVAYILGQALERRKGEQELKRARDEALESARAKSAFLANMSHEIRTPLNSIVGLSGLLLETSLGSEQRDFAETIRLSSDVLLETLNNVLDFSKFSTGKTSLENTDFDLRVVVQTAVDVLAAPAAKKNLEVAFFVAEKLPRALRGDPGRLRQILVNLLGNAVKFTAAGQVVLKVTLERETDQSAVLRFEVSDTGIGIAPETQRHLFQPFHQADVSTTRKYGGSGLGLAICAQLVQLMGGQIGVRSQLDEGSTFWFTAALGKVALAASAPDQPHQLSGIHVLIVDDNATDRQILRLQLESSGVRIDEAAGGAQALALMRKEATNDPYAFALLDLQMPEMDGLELARRIRADPSLSKALLVMMSSTEARPRSVKDNAAFDTWFAKPVKPAELLRCLASMPLEPRQTQPPPQRAQRTKAAPLPARILMAEDNPINQKVALIQLKKLGYQPEVVGNGRAAVEAFKRAQYDLVLMDCQMPEMDGYEATQEIRRIEAGSPGHTTIIALTAFGLSGDREKCLAAGMDDYLSKPIKIEQLREMLERWLAPKISTPASPSPAPGAGERGA